MLPSLDERRCPLGSFMRGVRRGLSKSSLGSSRTRILFGELGRLGVNLVSFGACFGTSGLSLLCRRTDRGFRMRYLTVELSTGGSFDSDCSCLTGALTRASRLGVGTMTGATGECLGCNRLLLTLRQFGGNLSGKMTERLAMGGRNARGVGVLRITGGFGIVINGSSVSSRRLFVQVGS